jgi:hypothetical protein
VTVTEAIIDFEIDSKHPTQPLPGVFTTFALLFAQKSERRSYPLLSLNERAYLLPSPLRGEGKGEGGF